MAESIVIVSAARTPIAGLLGDFSSLAAWASLLSTLSVQRRVTASLRRRDGRTVRVRKSTVAEPALMTSYRALGLRA